MSKACSSQEAMNYFVKVIELKPDDADSYNNRGNILYKLGRLEESRIALEKAISMQPYYAVALHSRKILFRKLGRKARERVA